MKKKANNPKETKELLTITEVAELFGVHPETLRRWDNEGKLKALRIGGHGNRRYRKSEIEELLKSK